MTRIPSYPDLVGREATAALAAFAVVAVLSAFLDAPLDGPLNPAVAPPDDIKAPWIFVGVQLFLRWMDPLLAGFVIPVAGLLLLASLPLIASRKTLPRLLFAITLAVMALSTLGGYLR